MSQILQKMLRAREVRIPADKYTFIARRPTPLEREEKFKDANPARAILTLIIGWENVTEADLIPGGDPHPIAFDAAACVEWLADRPDLFAVVVGGIVSAFEAYAKQFEERLGN